MSRGSGGGGHDDDCCGGGVLVVVEMLLFPVFRGVMLPGFQGFYAGFRHVRTTTAGTTFLFPEFADELFHTKIQHLWLGWWEGC